jgi:hypothetical protein
LLRERGGPLVQFEDVHPTLVHQLEVAHQHSMTVHLGPDAVSSNSLKPRSVAGLDLPLAGTGHDGLG